MGAGILERERDLGAGILERGRDLGAGTGFGYGNFGAGGSEQRYSGKPDGVAGTPKSFFLCQIKSAFKHIFSLFFLQKKINTIFVF